MSHVSAPRTERSHHRSEHVRRSVLLWVAVTLALWAALPVAMYLSHWQWFAWVPRVGAAPPPPRTVLPPDVHTGPTPVWVNMASLLMMSSVLMAVVLWLLGLRGHRSAGD
jgi:hypothetical protein